MAEEHIALTKSEAYAVLAIAEKRARLQREAEEATRALQDLAVECARKRGIDTEAVQVDFTADGDDIVLTTTQRETEPEAEV